MCAFIFFPELSFIQAKNAINIINGRKTALNACAPFRMKCILHFFWSVPMEWLSLQQPLNAHVWKVDLNYCAIQYHRVDGCRTHNIMQKMQGAKDLQQLSDHILLEMHAM